MHCVPYTTHLQGPHQPPCRITLRNEDLWKKFSSVGTEMILTKSGRRMFPYLEVQINDLDPTSYYCIFLSFTPANNYRYKYSTQTGWVQTASEEVNILNHLYVHPDSPSTGEQWMSKITSFSKLKLTNSLQPPPKQIGLISMHKYQPQIIIAKSYHPDSQFWISATGYVFDETQFIAVTAYQSDELTMLKIFNNPFAKGFRQNDNNKRKYMAIKKESEAAEEIPNENSPQSSQGTEDDSLDYQQHSPASQQSYNEMYQSQIVAPTELYPSPNAYYNSNYYYDRIFAPYSSYNFMLPRYYPYAYGYNTGFYPNTYGKSTCYGSPKRLRWDGFTDFSIRAILEM